MACIYLLNSRGGTRSFDFVITTYSYPLLLVEFQRWRVCICSLHSRLVSIGHGAHFWHHAWQFGIMPQIFGTMPHIFDPMPFGPFWTVLTVVDRCWPVLTVFDNFGLFFVHWWLFLTICNCFWPFLAIYHTHKRRADCWPYGAFFLLHFLVNLSHLNSRLNKKIHILSNF